MKVQLARQSICGCGHPAVNLNVNSGKEYEFPRFNAVATADWICGGCGKTQKVLTILLYQDNGRLGPMPIDLFDWPPELEHKFAEAKRQLEAMKPSKTQP